MRTPGTRVHPSTHAREYIIRAQNQWRSRGWNTTRRREIAFALSVNPIARVAEAHPGRVIKLIITPSRGYLVLAVNLGANRRRHRCSNGIRLNAITAAAPSYTALLTYSSFFGIGLDSLRLDLKIYNSLKFVIDDLFVIIFCDFVLLLAINNCLY